MALTDAQKLDVRRFAGYPALGDVQVDDTRDMARSWVSPGVLETLTRRLNTLRPEEESVLTTKYLPRLNTLEDAIYGASDNLDTAAASVWTRNANEVDDRTALYNQQRRAMCAFLGIQPGPGLGAGSGLRILRG